MGLHSKGSIDLTPEEAKCIDLFVEIKEGARQVFLPEGSGPWFVAGTSTTGFLTAVEAARLRKLGLNPERIRPAFKLGGERISEDELFAPRVGTVRLTRETRGGKVFSVVEGKAVGPASAIQIFRGVSCEPGAPLLATVTHTGGSFRCETKALLNNVCLRVVGSSAPPVGAGLSGEPCRSSFRRLILALT